MFTAADEPQGGQTLRHRAVARLTDGAPAGQRRASASEALAVLHQLATSPDTAGDALALLHELQVHQVELDLQREELRCSRAEIESALQRQSARIEQAPAGFLLLDASTVLSQANAAGVRLLGAAGQDLSGLRLSSLLSATGVAALQALLTRARAALPPQTRALQLLPRDGVSANLLATASLDPETGGFMLVVMAGPATAPDVPLHVAG